MQGVEEHGCWQAGNEGIQSSSSQRMAVARPRVGICLCAGDTLLSASTAASSGGGAQRRGRYCKLRTDGRRLLESRCSWQLGQVITRLAIGVSAEWLALAEVYECLIAQTTTHTPVRCHPGLAQTSCTPPGRSKSPRASSRPRLSAAEYVATAPALARRSRAPHATPYLNWHDHPRRHRAMVPAALANGYTRPCGRGRLASLEPAHTRAKRSMRSPRVLFLHTATSKVRHTRRSSRNSHARPTRAAPEAGAARR